MLLRACSPPRPSGQGVGRTMLSAVQAMMTRGRDLPCGPSRRRRAVAAVILGALSVLAFAPVHAWPVLFLTFGALVWLLDGCHARARASRRKTEDGGDDRILLRLRLFPRRTLLGCRGLPGRTVAPWLAASLRHDGSAWRHGALLRRGSRACHAPLGAGTGTGVRACDRFLPCRVRPRPRADRVSLEPPRLQPPRQLAADAACRALRRLCA